MLGHLALQPEVRGRRAHRLLDRLAGEAPCRHHAGAGLHLLGVGEPARALQIQAILQGDPASHRPQAGRDGKCGHPRITPKD